MTWLLAWLGFRLSLVFVLAWFDLAWQGFTSLRMAWFDIWLGFWLGLAFGLDSLLAWLRFWSGLDWRLVWLRILVGLAVRFAWLGLSSLVTWLLACLVLPSLLP